jgi:hypothetical protein
MNTKEKPNEIWNSIDKYSVEFLNENFEYVAPFLIEYLIQTKIAEDNFETGTLEVLHQKGSVISIENADGQKRLEIRCKKKSSYDLFLFIYEDNGETHVYRHRMTDEEINFVPPPVRLLMERVRRTGEPIVCNSEVID